MVEFRAEKDKFVFVRQRYLDLVRPLVGLDVIKAVNGIRHLSLCDFLLQEAGK